MINTSTLLKIEFINKLRPFIKKYAKSASQSIKDKKLIKGKINEKLVKALIVDMGNEISKEFDLNLDIKLEDLEDNE